MEAKCDNEERNVLTGAADIAKVLLEESMCTSFQGYCNATDPDPYLIALSLLMDRSAARRARDQPSKFFDSIVHCKNLYITTSTSSTLS